MKLWLLAVFFIQGFTFLYSTPAHAQLNENCVVSILNRTAQVKPDGSWRIDNVPANFGDARARFTCTENSVTTSGSSSLVDILANQSNGFDPEITLGAAAPIPERLEIISPVPILTTVGETAQLTVNALFADGSTTDVTASAAGTNYTVSNPAIAAIDDDGVLTAVMSGTVLVSALNEGASGFLQIQVSFTGDSDGDGIPDDVEIANGLDPDNPIDGMEDPDGDGLTNKEELVDFGTDFLVADTDGDGIENGEVALSRSQRQCHP